MALFQQSVIKKHIATLDASVVEAAWARFTAHFHNPGIQHNIRDAKEEEYQEGFVRDLFVDILGYTLKPQPDYNLVLEKKTETDATKSDGALLHDEKIVGVIELKDTGTTELDKIEKQVFGYKHKHKHCVYVITSNFEKLRFYINDATDFEEFNLFTLSKERFSILWLCLQQQMIAQDLPLKMKQASISQEENVTKKLYADYSAFKKELFASIVELNPQYNKLDLFKKTQKLLDRFLFILFAEDRGLLPPNSVREILSQWQQLKELDSYVPLYSRFTKYFGYLNTGYSGKQYDIFAYNGGLFAPDEILDHILIDDELLLKGGLSLSKYDFESEVDVNILGHIFEHSLTEIEEVQAKLEGHAVDKTKTKRKKDGVFYTPRYITKYIVENTVGTLCAEKKQQLGIQDDAFTPQKRKANTRQLKQQLDDYRQWLLQITICDPACGSGAFLNQALEFLIEEHRLIDELNAKLFGDAMLLTDVENSILENNIYGVDINDEAVEIARLSLWLRTARKGRKLNNLNANIKVGNSLIDDPAVAGDKAFNWQEEFKTVFDNGGFDVVIGNPPYVPAEMIAETDKKYFEAKYSSAKGRLNLFPIFYEKAIQLSKIASKSGLITPYTILKNLYYSQARKFILENATLENIIDFKGVPVFRDAAVDSVILIFTKGGKPNDAIEVIDSITNFENNLYYKRFVAQGTFAANSDYGFEISEKKIDFNKTNKHSKKLSEVVDFNQGIITGDNKSFITKQENNKTKMVITGSDFGRYSLHWSGDFIIYDEQKLHRPRKRSVFEASEKLILRQTGAYPICTYDNSGYYTLDTVHNGLLVDTNFSLLYIMALLNSRLLRYLYENSINEAGKVFAQVKIIYINPLPVKTISRQEQIGFVDRSNTMIAKNKELQHVKQQLQQLLSVKYTGILINTKLSNWPSLSFSEFLKELGKQKIKLSLSEEAEWMQYFNEQKAVANNIQQVIDATDAEIDKMVYELYELTEEEIKVVEGGPKNK